MPIFALPCLLHWYDTIFRRCLLLPLWYYALFIVIADYYRPRRHRPFPSHTTMPISFIYCPSCHFSLMSYIRYCRLYSFRGMSFFCFSMLLSWGYMIHATYFFRYTERRHRILQKRRIDRERQKSRHSSEGCMPSSGIVETHCSEASYRRKYTIMQWAVNKGEEEGKEMPAEMVTCCCHAARACSGAALCIILLWETQAAAGGGKGRLSASRSRNAAMPCLVAAAFPLCRLPMLHT